MGNIMLGHSGIRGGSGATLTVIGTNAEEGSEVWASKDGKTYKLTLDSNKKAVFKNLATGDWEVTMWGNEDQGMMGNSINITADYSLTMAYFTATINVTYPVGSTCTATDGTTTLTAPDTSGTWVCVVPNAGTWTVSCTDGTKTASKTVTVSAEGEAMSVELVYELLLFFDGNSYTDVTGGWVSKTETNPASCSVEGAYLVMYAGYGGYATGTTGNLIDLTNFNVLEVTIAESGAVTDNRSRVAVLDPTNQNLAYKDALTQGVHIVDLSEITGDCRIRFEVRSNLTYKISKVRLY